MYFLRLQSLKVLIHYIADSRCNYVLSQGVLLESEICLHTFHSHDITNIDKKIHYHRRQAMYISEQNNDKPLLIILYAKGKKIIIPHYIFG